MGCPKPLILGSFLMDVGSHDCRGECETIFGLPWHLTRVDIVVL